MVLEDISSLREFDPEKYVNEIGSRSVGALELSNYKSKIQTIFSETDVTIKKNVFEHYEQFIKTAKDVSYLAGEMYQISQMLRDQKTLIQNILDTSIIAPLATSKKMPLSRTESVDVKFKSGNSLTSDENQKRLLGILEKVEGLGDLLSEDTNRNLLHDGDLLELEPESYSAVQRKRGYLFNDGIMLAQWVPSRRGPQRFKFEAFYDLEGISLVVNIRDPECPKGAFKILIFPNGHLLQCPTQHEKDVWISQIESQQKHLRNPPISLNRCASVDNPVIDSPKANENRTKSPENNGIPAPPPLPGWVLDLPEDLDVVIAQRKFCEGVSLYENFLQFLSSQEELTSSLKDVRGKVESRMKHLAEVLISDLGIPSSSKILQGGCHSIRKSLNLLVRLGREDQASKLFFAYRSSYLKQQLSQLKGRRIVQRHSADCSVQIFSSNLSDTMAEYNKLFSETSGGAASVIVWVNEETIKFVDLFCKLVFTPQLQLSLASQSLTKLRRESAILTEVGVDVLSTVDSILLPALEKAVIDSKNKIHEGINHRFNSPEEIGSEMKLDKISFGKIIQDMGRLGIENMHEYVTNDASLRISSGVLAFAKAWLQFSSDFIQFEIPQMQHLIETSVCLLFQMQLEEVAKAKKEIKDDKIIPVVEQGVSFLFGPVCTAAGVSYKITTGKDFTELEKLVDEFSYLRGSNWSESKPVYL